MSGGEILNIGFVSSGMRAGAWSIATAAAGLILGWTSFAGAEQTTPIAPQNSGWTIDPAPIQLDRFRASMAQQGRMAIALISPNGEGWALDREATVALGRDPSILHWSEAEALGIDFSRRQISLLLPEFGPVNKARNGYMCLGMLSKPTRKQNGYNMCTTRLSKNIRPGFAMVTGIASLGTTSERVLNIDTDAIMAVATALNFDAMEASIIANSREGGWAMTSAARPPSSVPPPSTFEPRIDVSDDAVGLRICRDGILEYTSCANAQFASSCVRGQKPGQLQGYVEGYSPDRASIRILIAQPAFSDGQTPVLMTQYPTMNGLSSVPNTITWDARKNWRICPWK